MKANEFIKLHDVATNLPIGIATRNIALFESHDYQVNDKSTAKKTIIYMINPISFEGTEYQSVIVNENVERIMELIYDNK